MESVKAKIRYSIPIFVGSALSLLITRSVVSAETAGIEKDLEKIVIFFLVLGIGLFLAGGVMLVSALIGYLRHTRRL